MSGSKNPLVGKTPEETAITMSQVMLPQDTNPAGNVHGGVIMKLIDSAAGVVGHRHFRGNVVTASIDSLEFRSPVFVGNLVLLKASINQVWHTSMEVGVRVEAEDLYHGGVRHTASAYLTFVALDRQGRPAQVPPLICETPQARRRQAEAVERRNVRLAQKAAAEKREKSGGE